MTKKIKINDPMEELISPGTRKAVEKDIPQEVIQETPDILRELQEAKEELEKYKRIEEINKEKRDQRINLLLRKTAKKILTKKAKEEGLTINRYIENLIMEDIAK